MSRAPIITFYSYKGGVGRSFALANVATLLSRWGFRVLCIDWDIEAPGLSHYFRPYVAGESAGLLEILDSFQSGDVRNWRSELVPVRIPNGEQMHLLPAGRQADTSYVPRVQRIDWRALYQNGFGRYVEELRESAATEYDFVLIDGRTGITDFNAIVTAQLPDIAVFLFTANEQSVEGTIDVARRALDARNRLPVDRGGLLILPVPARFEDRVEFEIAQHWRRQFVERMSRFYDPWVVENVDRFALLDYTTIPYVPYFSFGELLSVLHEDRPFSTKGVSYSIETIAALLVNRLARADMLITDRDAYVADASRRPEKTLFVSRAASDAPIAESLGRILADDGYSVIVQETAQESFLASMHDALASGARVVALLSAAYLSSDYCRAAWQSVLAGDPLNRQNRLIVFRIENVEPRGLFAGIAYWDLVPIISDPPRLVDTVRNAVREGRLRDQTPSAGPHWTAPRALFDPEIRRVAGFVDRVEELAMIEAALSAQTDVAVVGLGGIGKSALAREYALRYRDRYSLVWFLHADSERAIIDGLLRLGTVVAPGLEHVADRRVAAEQVVASVLSGFEGRLLLVLDDLSDEDLLRAWLPRGRISVLITSRNSAWTRSIERISLHSLSSADAAHFLLEESGRADITYDEASAITETLGGLPLALELASAYLKRSRNVTAQSFLTRFSALALNRLADGSTPTAGGLSTVFAAFEAAIAEAEARAPGSAAILCLAAYLAPDAVPEELFRPSQHLFAELDVDLELQPRLQSPDEALDLRSLLGDVMRADEALGALDQHSLVKFSVATRTFDVHRLVQAAARDLSDDAPSWIRAAVAVVDTAFPFVEYETWPLCERLLPHARAALDALPPEDVFAPAARLARQTGSYLRERASFADAESLLRRALAIDEALFGSEHIAIAQDLNNLADVLTETNRFDEAENLYRRSLAIDETLLGNDHAQVARDLNDLATVLGAKGRHGEAESIMHRALAITEATYGREHPDVAMALNNLGRLLSALGRRAEAEPLLRRALHIDEDAYGPDHPDIAIGLSNLGRLLYDLDRFSEAEPLLRRALAIDEQAYGPDHTAVAADLMNLATLLYRTGRVEEAEQLMRRALAIDEASLGIEHPRVVSDLVKLSDLLAETGRRSEAENLLRRLGETSA